MLPDEVMQLICTHTSITDGHCSKSRANVISFTTHPPAKLICQHLTSFITISQPYHISKVVIWVEVHTTTHSEQCHQSISMASFLTVNQQAWTLFWHSGPEYKIISKSKICSCDNETFYNGEDFSKILSKLLSEIKYKLNLNSTQTFTV